MRKIPFLKQLLILSLISALLLGCGKNDENSNNRKKRRSATENTSKTKKTLPALSTTTTTFSKSTIPVSSVPFSKPSQIQPKWNATTLCALVSAGKAKSILGLSTIPSPKYTFSESSGARCTYASGAGDEIYIELSVTSYLDARSIDTALNTQVKGVVISGVGGVVKTDSANGTTYELNVSGDNANQWIANADTTAKAKKLAETLVGSLT